MDFQTAYEQCSKASDEWMKTVGISKLETADQAREMLLSLLTYQAGYPEYLRKKSRKTQSVKWMQNSDWHMTLGQLLALVGLARLLALWVIGVEILQYASFAWLCVPVEIMAENGFQGNIWIWPIVIVFAAGIACCVLSCVRWCRQYITN